MQGQKLAGALKAQEIDGEAIYALAESPNFEIDFSSFVNVLKCHDATISLPFGKLIKMKSAIQKLNDQINAEKSETISANQATPRHESTAGEFSDRSNEKVLVLPNSANVAPVQWCLGEQSAHESDVVYYYQTVEKDEPIKIVLKSSEATPLGLKKAIAESERIDFTPDSDGLMPSQAHNGPASFEVASSDDHDFWNLQVKLKGSSEVLDVVRISNQKVFAPPPPNLSRAARAVGFPRAARPLAAGGVHLRRRDRRGPQGPHPAPHRRAAGAAAARPSGRGGSARPRRAAALGLRLR